MSNNFILQPNQVSTPLKVQIQVCSDCKKHSWYTWHREQNYLGIAIQIQKAITLFNQSAQVEIYKVGESKVGAFQITCNGILLFSKIKLGYFPRVSAFMSRLMNFVDDLQNGRDLGSYTKKQKSILDTNMFEKSSRTTIFRPNSSRSTRRGNTFRVRLDQQEREKMQRKICKTQEVQNQKVENQQLNNLTSIQKTDNRGESQSQKNEKQEQIKRNNEEPQKTNLQVNSVGQNKGGLHQNGLQGEKKGNMQENQRANGIEREKKAQMQQPSNITKENNKMPDKIQKQQSEHNLVNYQEPGKHEKEDQLIKNLAPDNYAKEQDANLNPQIINDTKGEDMQQGKQGSNSSNFIL